VRGARRGGSRVPRHQSARWRMLCQELRPI
jgi:hypothetical protein